MKRGGGLHPARPLLLNEAPYEPLPRWPMHQQYQEQCLPLLSQANGYPYPYFCPYPYHPMYHLFA